MRHRLHTTNKLITTPDTYHPITHPELAPGNFPTRSYHRMSRREERLFSVHRHPTLHPLVTVDRIHFDRATRRLKHLTQSNIAHLYYRTIRPQRECIRREARYRPPITPITPITPIIRIIRIIRRRWPLIRKCLRAPIIKDRQTRPTRHLERIHKIRRR